MIGATTPYAIMHTRNMSLCQKIQERDADFYARLRKIGFLLDFGDFYMLLANEYASQYDPEGLAFDFKILDQFVKSALKLYSEVAQVDGIVEKLEAQGKIEAARGFLEKMTRLNR